MPATSARTIAARIRVAGVTRVICPPFVSLAVVRDAWRRPTRTSGSAPRTSITSSRAPTPARSPRRCWSGSRRGSSSVTRSGAATRARPTSSSAASSAGRSMPACARSCAWASGSPNARRAPRRRSSGGSSRAPSAITIPRPCAPPVWSSPTSRSGRSGRAGTRAVGTRPRWPRRSGTPCSGSVARRTPTRCRSCTAAASRRPTSPSSSPSRRSTARSSAARR